MTTSSAQERFSGIARLYGVAALDRLAEARVAVIGVGGVGSWAAEALVRSGVGAVALFDMDDVCVTNTNRQLHALADTVGRPKVDTMAERLRAIDPGVSVETIPATFDGQSAAAVLDRPLDWVIDAIDDIRNKALLVAACRERGIGIVVSGGAGGRRDPARVRIDDLTRSTNDSLLRDLRRRLRRSHGFEVDGPWDVPCVYSTERQTFPTDDGRTCDRPEADARLRLDCRTGFGTAAFVTGAFGLALASVVVSAVADPEHRGV